MLDIEVRGADELDALSSRLRAAATGGLRRSVQEGIERSVRPLPQALGASIERRIPRAGRLASRVASSTRVTVRAGAGGDAGVHVEASGPYNLRGMDAGQVTHPVFGDRRNWITQPIPRGWFSEPAQDIERDVQQAVEKAVRDVADQITS